MTSWFHADDYWLSRFVFLRALALIRLLVGDEFRLHSVEMAYPAPAHAERYRQLFECPVHFGCPRSLGRMERRWLSAPIATHSAVMAAQLAALLEQQAQARAQPPRSTEAVEQVLLRSGNARLSIDQVASTLQLSVRTLNRKSVV